MSEMTAEQFGQRTFDLGLVDAHQLEMVWGELGSRDVPLESVCSSMVRKELLTNYQVDRLLRGERTGFFYGKYKVLYLIGTGTFARVYRAEHCETGKIVAVKVLRKRYRENLVELEQFLREGRVGQQLRHVNVVPIYEVSGDRRAPYMVMEFVEGQNLRELIGVRKKLDVKISLRLLIDVLNGLAYAAEKGITHRDLKMSNVLVNSSGRAKLVDFGLAAAANLSDDALADCPNARAIDYAALERGTGVRKDDIRSDIFFAGCIFYHVLTGVPPLFETRDRLQRLSITRFRDIKPVSQVAPNLPPSIVAVVNRAMELDPARRYATPSEMLADVKQVALRIKQGELDVAPKARESVNNHGVATAKPPPVTQEGESRRVMIIESNIPMQNVLREKLKRRGYRVLITSDPGRALARFDDDPTVADCAVFCSAEIGKPAVDAFNEFGKNETTRDLPAILFVDQKQRELKESAEVSEHRVILSMPLKVRALRETLLKLLSEPSTS